HDDVGGGVLELGARLGQRGGGPDVEALGGQGFLAHHAEHPFVVDHEHRRSHASSMGKLSRNTAPGCLRSSTRSPPWARAILREVESPIPTPLGLPVTKGSKSRVERSSETPRPLSSTRISAAPGAALRDTESFGGSAVATASSAFETRFPMTIWR